MNTYLRLIFVVCCLLLIGVGLRAQEYGSRQIETYAPISSGGMFHSSSAVIHTTNPSRLSKVSASTQAERLSVSYFSPLSSRLSPSFSSQPQYVPALSGDLQPFNYTELRKAPPIGNDDDEGDNPDIKLPIPDGNVFLLLVCTILIFVKCLKHIKE